MAGVAPLHHARVLAGCGAVERPSVVPTFAAVRSTSEAPGSTPAASPWLRRRHSPWPPHPSEQYRARSSPPRTAGGCAPRTSPHPPGWSWRRFKRRNNTGSLRIPSRLAHRARPFRQYRTVPTLSRLLPPSPATPGNGCLQLHPTATTARRRRSPTSIRNISASWRTAHRQQSTVPADNCCALHHQTRSQAHRHHRRRGVDRNTPGKCLSPAQTAPCAGRHRRNTQPSTAIFLAHGGAKHPPKTRS